MYADRERYGDGTKGVKLRHPWNACLASSAAKAMEDKLATSAKGAKPQRKRVKGDR